MFSQATTRHQGRVRRCYRLYHRSQVRKLLVSEAELRLVPQAEDSHYDRSGHRVWRGQGARSRLAEGSLRR